MGDQTYESIHSRIFNAMDKAKEDGYTSETMIWGVTPDSILAFQTMWEYTEINSYHLFLHPQIPKSVYGAIGNVIVYRDERLKGTIAELQTPDDYRITLDLADHE